MSGILSMMFAGQMAALTLDISNRVNPDVVSLLNAAGWAGVQHPVILVNNGLVNTLNIPSSLNGADLTLINAAGCRIGGLFSGGTALITRAAIKVQNLGILSGGGGAGGIGGSAWVRRTLSTGASQYASGSGGGGGFGQGFLSGSLTISSAGAASSGSTGYLAPSGSWGPGDPGRAAAWAYGGYGGDGGAWGQTGNYGGSGQAVGDYDTGEGYADRAPGLAGFYVDGNSYVTWLATGTRLGRVQ
ncbi:MAG: hypothetical protein WBC18_14865 [Ottowia sp.]|uniref:hypothetical protein n=1 Tax=Ottowia sp. TaxID=1898956 RepID=UPI003C75934C